MDVVGKAAGEVVAVCSVDVAADVSCPAGGTSWSFCAGACGTGYLSSETGDSVGPQPKPNETSAAMAPANAMYVVFLIAAAL